MSTSGIGPTTTNYNTYQTQTTPPAAQPPADTASNNSQANPVDTYTPSSPAAASSANNSAVRGRPADPTAIRNLISSTNHQVDAVRRLISSALGRTEPTGQGFWAQRADNLQLNATERAEAQALVAEDGFFGVSQTTDRIMDFARAMVGENASPEQIEEMRAAVQRGFDDVSRMFGGFDNLPQVSRDTHAAIMSQFDDWAASAGGATNTQ
ncbi:MAG: hypothetical protein FWC13_04615 [Oscillospiraceae bacterium]|nr:hypothetical protein [Oscillospiraceae bacterium]